MLYPVSVYTETYDCEGHLNLMFNPCLVVILKQLCLTTVN